MFYRLKLRSIENRLPKQKSNATIEEASSVQLMQQVVNQPLDNVASRLFKIEQQLVLIVSQGQNSSQNISALKEEVAAIK
jgi:hypothetical protein